MERILVYKNETYYNRYEKIYQSGKNELQSLVYGLIKIGYTADLESIKQLVKNREDLRDILADRYIEKTIPEMPQIIKDAAREAFLKEKEPKYQKLIEERIYKLWKYFVEGISEWSGFYYLLKWDVYSIDKDNNVILSDDHIKYIEDICCEYAEGETQIEIYNKLIKVKESIEELNEAVKAAPKVKQSEFVMSGYNNHFLRGIASDNGLCLCSVDANGELEIHGNNFCQFL